MNRRLDEIARRQGCVFTRGQAATEGYDDRAIARLLRTREWHRVRRGVYADGELWEALDELGRHRLQVCAVCLRCSDDAVVSHVSAAAVWRLPLWDVPLDEVWLTRRLAGLARAESGIRHHVADLPDDQVTEVDGIQVTIPERTMVDVSRRVSFESAVVTLDAALRQGADRELARDIFLRCSQWPMARGAVLPLDFADGRSESPLESRTRVFCHAHDLPIPTPQVPVMDEDGTIFARVDLMIVERLVAIECDGKVKYTPRPDGVNPEFELYREKRREDRLREAGLEVVRVSSRDLRTPRQTVARILAAIRRADQRRGFAA